MCPEARHIKPEAPRTRLHDDSHGLSYRAAAAEISPPTVAAMPSTMSLVAAFFLTGAAPMERRMPERVALMASAPIGLGTLAILCM